MDYSTIILKDHWADRTALKSELLTRCEQYARWTVPSAFPEDITKNTSTPTETEKGNVEIGARLVNHLAHRIVETMFPNDRPFFALTMTPEAKKVFDAENAENTNAATLVQDALSNAENAAMRKLNLTTYRPVAIQAVTLKIVTGNALIHRLPNGKRVVYSIRDYCIKRSISGDPYEVLLRDIVLFEQLDEDMQTLVKVNHPNAKHDTPFDLYTLYYFDDKRWHRRQQVDTHKVPSADKSFTEDEFPCLPLVWNLGRGDDYGRGLVEEYSVSFHNLDVMTEALIDMIGIAADVKWLVNDTSSFDVEQWNNAKRGEYVPGKEGDITAPQFKFAMETQLIAEAIAKRERELSNAFLLSSAGVRDAERVTAEEIRFFAREIESAFGGLYSRMAVDWQRREALYQMTQINLKSYLPDGTPTFEPMVTSGLESLSREGKLDHLRLALSDLQYLDTVPEDIRKGINPIKFMAFVFRNRSVDGAELLYTQAEMDANTQAEQQRQADLINQQGESQAAVAAAGKLQP